MEGNDFNLIPARAPVVSEEALKENAASSRIITVTADQAADILSSTKHPLNLAYHWVYAAPDQWVEGKNSAGRSTRHQLIPDNQKGPIVFEDELANHLDSKDSVKGDKLVYEVWVDDFGTHETNAQVGRKRMFRLIRHQDMKNAPNIVVQFPGFAHTHRFHDTRWFLALIAQAAKIKNCNFLFMDPMGKGLPGYDGADNISNISSEDIISDTNASTVNALDAMTARYKLKKERLNIVPIGHSLGARLARAFAANLVKLNKEGNNKYRLSGIIQEAGTTAPRLGNLSIKYIKAIFPHLRETVTKMFAARIGGSNQAGKNFTLKDIRDLFVNGYGIPENLFFVGASLQDGELGNFWDLTMNNSDIDEFFDTVESSFDDIHNDEFGIGNKYVNFTDDQIFDHSKDKTQLHAPEANIRKVESGVPHSYVVPIPTDALIEKVARMLEFELNIKPFTLKTAGLAANETGRSSERPSSGIPKSGKQNLDLPKTQIYTPVDQQGIVTYMESRRNAA